MPTIAELRLPAEDTALAETFDRVPDASLQLEPTVSGTSPCVWLSGTEREAADEGLEADPTVGSFELLVDTGDRLLYDVAFAEDAARLFDDLLAEGGSLLEARGSNGWWQVRMRFHDHADLGRTHERLLDRGINADVRRVAELSEASATNSRLTPEQQEALAAAFERGYFEIPRGISMEELADELDISHQALSERLRRAYETLVDSELQPADGRST